MWQSQFAVYLGQETEEGFFGFISEGNFYLVLETREGLNKEKGREILSIIKQELVTTTINSLVDFESFINGQIKKQNLPTGISLVTGLVIDNIFYLKTVSEGKIFIRRKNNFEKIIENDQTASGYVETNDFFIFTSDRFIQLFGQETELKTIFNHKNPHQIVEDLAPQMKTGNDQGAIALFTQFLEKESISQEEEQEKTIISRPMILEKGQNVLDNIYQKFKQYKLQTDKKKTLTFIIIIVLALILFWSVGLGYARRKESQLTKKISRSRELITQKLDQAEEVAFLNLARSQALISEARNELNNLKKEVGDKKKEELTGIENIIKEKEAKILNKEEKKAEEFFDLTVDNKSAQGLKLYLDENNLAILDKNQGIVYKLSLAKKSLNKVNDSQIKLTRLIAGYQDEIFFYINGKGVYKISQQTKAKLAIDNDNDWGKITDNWIYNGNIYLLDTEKNDIYKYLSGEDKYGSKSSYFKPGEAIRLTGATSMAIDSSLYIGFNDYLVKYTAGARDAFKTSFPEEGVSLTKIYTSKDLEKVYGWDKNKGVVYILAKNGTYERQVKSSILTKGDDLVVFENSAYVVVKEKIYRVSLD